jgi:hypothetical protein
MRAAEEPVRDRLELVSHFAGRLRVRAATFRVLPDVGSAVATELRALDGVTECTTSPITGSVLIRYEPTQVQLPKLVATIVRTGGLHGLALVTPPDEASPAPGERMRRALGEVDRRARVASNGRLDLRTAIPAALAGTGLAMLLTRRRRVPEWYDLLFWGFVTFCNMNPKASPAPDDGDRS